LKIINCLFLVTSKSTVLKGLCQSDLFVKTKTKKKKKNELFFFPSDHNDFKGYNCLRGNNFEIISWPIPSSSVGIELLSSWTCPYYLFHISMITIKMMVVMVKTDQFQYLSQVIRLYKQKIKPY